MEENIKILEQEINDIYVECGATITNAIENLIKGYRDSEDIMKNAVKENLELKEYIRELEEDNQKFESGKFLTPAQCVRIGKDYIPKSKVKEKIEELEKSKQKYEEENTIDEDYYFDINGYDKAIWALQELLGDEE